MTNERTDLSFGLATTNILNITIFDLYMLLDTHKLNKKLSIIILYQHDKIKRCCQKQACLVCY